MHEIMLRMIKQTFYLPLFGVSVRGVPLVDLALLGLPPFALLSFHPLLSGLRPLAVRLACHRWAWRYFARHCFACGVCLSFI